MDVSPPDRACEEPDAGGGSLLPLSPLVTVDRLGGSGSIAMRNVSSVVSLPPPSREEAPRQGGEMPSGVKGKKKPPNH